MKVLALWILISRNWNPRGDRVCRSCYHKTFGGSAMCGIFGIANHSDASQMTYLGLYALQHRGQESTGISSSDGDQVYTHKAMGYVADVFSEDVINKLKGANAIGHTRYSTAGDSSEGNAQPIVVKSIRTYG